MVCFVVGGRLFFVLAFIFWFVLWYRTNKTGQKGKNELIGDGGKRKTMHAVWLGKIPKCVNLMCLPVYLSIVHYRTGGGS